jgi:hypothetical protein
LCCPFGVSARRNWLHVNLAGRGELSRTGKLKRD